MTDKEAIEYLKGQIKCLKCETGIDCENCILPNWSKEIEIEALNRAIEALENQKSIIKELEQIRAEIDALDKWGQNFYRYNEALGDCIEIIDNHIEEMKGEQK